MKKNCAVCPVNWNRDDDAMEPTADGVAEYFTDHAGWYRISKG